MKSTAPIQFERAEQHDGRLIGKTLDSAGAELEADGHLGQIVAFEEEDLEAVGEFGALDFGRPVEFFGL